MDLTSMATSKRNLHKDWQLERTFARQVKAALGNVFIEKDINADLNSGQDFAIYTVRAFNVAVRLRRSDYFKPRYANEFTIRWLRPSGAKTEIDKIRSGLVDYLFYGFVSEKDGRILQWFLGDLAVFREIDPEPNEIHDNKPYDSKLAVYDIAQFPSEFLVHFYRAKPN